MADKLMIAELKSIAAVAEAAAIKLEEGKCWPKELDKDLNKIRGSLNHVQRKINRDRTES